MQNISLEQYQSFNNTIQRRELIFHVGATSGFYSEFNNMVLAMVYCLEHKIKFSMYSADAIFKYENGWQDYFLPFCNEITDEFHHKYNLRHADLLSSLNKIERLKLFMWKIRHKRTYLTYDVFLKYRTKEFEQHFFTIPELGYEGNLLNICRQIINIIYRFNDETSLEIQKNIDSLGLPQNYIGLHIRWGDKVTECELKQCSAYISKAEQLSPLRSAFISTDDYRVVETLQRDYKDWTFYTLTDVSEKGYYHDDFIMSTSTEKRQKMIKLFTSMEIVKNSELFVGTFSSNPGMFIGMCMDNAHGVDMDKWVLW